MVDADDKAAVQRRFAEAQSDLAVLDCLDAVSQHASKAPKRTDAAFRVSMAMRMAFALLEQHVPDVMPKGFDGAAVAAFLRDDARFAPVAEEALEAATSKLEAMLLVPDDDDDRPTPTLARSVAAPGLQRFVPTGAALDGTDLTLSDALALLKDLEGVPKLIIHWLAFALLLVYKLARKGVRGRLSLWEAVKTVLSPQILLSFCLLTFESVLMLQTACNLPFDEAVYLSVMQELPRESMGAKMREYLLANPHSQEVQKAYQALLAEGAVDNFGRPWNPYQVRMKLEEMAQMPGGLGTAYKAYTSWRTVKYEWNAANYTGAVDASNMAFAALDAWIELVLTRQGSLAGMNFGYYNTLNMLKGWCLLAMVMLNSLYGAQATAFMAGFWGENDEDPDQAAIDFQKEIDELFGDLESLPKNNPAARQGEITDLGQRILQLAIGLRANRRLLKQDMNKLIRVRRRINNVANNNDQNMQAIYDRVRVSVEDMEQVPIAALCGSSSASVVDALFAAHHRRAL